MKWLLFILVQFNPPGTDVRVQEFSTLQLCQQAADWLNAEKGTMWRNPVKAVCFRAE